MTTLAIYPFYSQQDKLTGKFLLSTCGACKQLSWLVKQVRQELGWRVEVAVPAAESVADKAYPFDVEALHPVDIEPNNLIERVRWDFAELRRTFAGADVALLNHELLAVPVRRLRPRLRIVTMCNTDPRGSDELLFVESWRSSDVVVAQSPVMADYIRQQVHGSNVVVAPMCFDKLRLVPRRRARDIDVLFVARCSASNHTHHEEFLRAMPLMRDLKVVFTDVTNYLKKLRPEDRKSVV